MLEVNAQNFGDIALLHCKGRIVSGDASLKDAVRSLKNICTLVLNLAQVDAIDAGGLGVLVDLQAWAQSRRIQFKLTNASNSVRHVLELTQLDRVFEIYSERELFRLLRRATRIGATPGRAILQINKRSGFDVAMVKTGT